MGSVGFEFATRPIPPALTAYVRSWSGYVERTPGPVRRRELPAPLLAVILEFGPPIRVFESGSEQRSARYRGGFAAGLDDQFSLTDHAGYQAGMELKLTPLGGRTLFGVPAVELSRRVVSLPELLPRDHRSLAERLGNMPDWKQRFDFLERFLLDAVRRSDPSVRPAFWAARRIEATGGAIDIGALCRELGYSHKHVLQLFRDDVGLSPKAYARLIRFHGLVQQLRAAQRAPDSLGWAALALEAGYADQPHLAREVKLYSGLTPTELVRLLEGYPL